MELHRLMEDYVLLDEDDTVVESGHFAAYRTHPWALLGNYGQGAARKLTGYAAIDPDGHRLLLTAVGCEVLVRECAAAILSWLNNFDLGLTSSNMTSVTGGSELMIGGIEFCCILRLDGLV